MQLFLQAEDDDDKEAVAAALEGAAEVFRALGPGTRPEPHATKLAESVLAVIQKKSTCQRVRAPSLARAQSRSTHATSPVLRPWA